jgi:hypothetical protein
VADYKIVFQYVEAGKGFQEVYYRNASTLQQAATIDTDLIYALTSFRNPLTYLKKARVSDTLNLRNTAVVNINTSSGYNPGNPAASGVCAVFQLNGLAPGGTRQLRLRGLNTGDMIRNPGTGADSMSADLTIRTNYLLNALQSRNFEIRSLIPTANTPTTWPQITSVTGTAGSGLITLNYMAGLVVTAGQYIKVTQVNQKLFPGLTGLFQAVAVTGTSVTIKYNPAQTFAATGLQKGRFKIANFQYGIINATNSAFSQWSTRITGKDPTGGRGRRTGQRLRSA